MISAIQFDQEGTVINHKVGEVLYTVLLINF